MKKIVLFFSIVIIMASCKSIDNYNIQATKLHPVEDVHEDVDNVYKKLKKLHPRLYQFANKETLDYKFDSLKKAINKPITSREFYKKLAVVTKYIGQGHLSVSPPFIRFNRKERLNKNKMQFDLNNLDLEFIDNKLIVFKAKGKDSLLVNAEILKVDGKTAQNLMDKYKNWIVSDGYNTTLHDRVVGKRFFRYYQYDIGRFDSISLTFKNRDSTFKKQFKRKLKSQITNKDSLNVDSLKIKKSKTKVSKAERKANRLKRKKEFKDRQKYGYSILDKQKTRALTFVGKDSTVAFVKIREFSRGNYKAFYKETFTILDSLKTETLIIDLRNNFGGRLSEIANLYSYLTDKNFTFINKSEVNSRIPTLKYLMGDNTSVGGKIFSGVLSPFLLVRDLVKTSKDNGKLYYKFKYAKEQEPKPLNFKGKIYVLINGNSFSASSILSTQLKGTKRATFVGEETGGAYNGTVAGLYKTYELPNTKVKANIGMLHIDSKYKIEPDGYGIKPDIEIVPTYKDRLNNRDPELEWILKDINKK